MVTPVEEPPLDPTQYQQLLLQQVTPLKTGLLPLRRGRPGSGTMTSSGPVRSHISACVAMFYRVANAAVVTTESARRL